MTEPPEEEAGKAVWEEAATLAEAQAAAVAESQHPPGAWSTKLNRSNLRKLPDRLHTSL